MNVFPGAAPSSKPAPGGGAGEEHPATWDPVILALTRPAIYFGVPLLGYMLALMAAATAFNASRLVLPFLSLWWRLGLCVAAFAAAIAVMWRLNSWEQQWSAILRAWWDVRRPQLGAASTAAFGGTTRSPLPPARRLLPHEVADYAGGFHGG